MTAVVRNRRNHSFRSLSIACIQNITEHCFTSYIVLLSLPNVHRSTLTVSISDESSRKRLQGEDTGHVMKAVMQHQSLRLYPFNWFVHRTKKSQRLGQIWDVLIRKATQAGISSIVALLYLMWFTSSFWTLSYTCSSSCVPST